jgi:ribosomal protein S18 acetylase RimI-like enzyme
MQQIVQLPIIALMLEIKVATIADATLISIISKQTFYEAFHAQNTKTDMDLFLKNNFNVKETELEIDNVANTFYLAYQNAELCAYAKVIDADNAAELPNTKTLRISRIYVLDKFIRQGIGKILMQTCIDKAISLKKDIVWLGVWEQNSNAIIFYKHYGFQQFGTEIFVLGTDPQTDLLMQKAI